MERKMFELAIILCYLYLPMSSTSATGGWGPTNDPTGDVYEMVEKVQFEVENDAGGAFNIFYAYKYRSQVVAGTQYLVRVGIGEENFVDIRFFKALPQTGGSLNYFGYSGGKKKDDPLVPF